MAQSVGLSLWYYHHQFLSKKVNRWLIYLKQYDFKLEHTKGKDNVVTDALSRNIQGMIARDEEGMVGSLKGEVPKTLMSNLKNLSVLQRGDKSIQAIFQENVNLEIRNKILYRIDNGKKRIVVPNEVKHELIWFYHEYFGHAGVYKTRKGVEQRFIWKGICRDIQSELQQCHECPVLAANPLDLVAVDLYGPLPTSQAKCKYIVVILDVFTKYVRLYGLKDAVTKVILKKFDNFIKDCGQVRSILSDQGPQFTSHQWAKYWKTKRTKVIHTSRYTPTSNLAERVMRTLGDFFRKHTREI